MLTLFQCMDRGGDSHDIRQQVRPRHLEWITHHMERVRVAGPIMDENNDSPKGSFYIIEGESIDDAMALLRSDPYYQAGIWDSVSSLSVRDYAGTWVGGKNW